jgi:PhnB protein
MLRLTPFLLFDGNCAEAMQFYHACFGGNLTLTRLADTPMKHSFPPDKHSRITYANLRSNAVDLSATDWLHPTQLPTLGNMTAMYITGTDPAELRAIFDKLADGAGPETFTPLREMPFGLYGSLTDRFGKQWFFRGENPAA